MRRPRVWLWRTLARLAGAVMRWCNGRAARACGCDSCRLMWDPRAQARAVEEMVARFYGGGLRAA